MTNRYRVLMLEHRRASNYDEAMRLLRDAVDGQQCWPSRRMLREMLQRALRVLDAPEVDE